MQFVIPVSPTTSSVEVHRICAIEPVVIFAAAYNLVRMLRIRAMHIKITGRFILTFSFGVPMSCWQYIPIEVVLGLAFPAVYP